MWKNDKFTVTQEEFRQSNSLVFSLVKMLFSRNSCQNNVTEDFRNFHTVRGPLTQIPHTAQRKLSHANCIFRFLHGNGTANS